LVRVEMVRVGWVGLFMWVILGVDFFW